LFPEEQPCSQKNKLKFPQWTTMFLKEKELIFSKDMIVLQERKV
jgi:hypothetical protein